MADVAIPALSPRVSSDTSVPDSPGLAGLVIFSDWPSQPGDLSSLAQPWPPQQTVLQDNGFIWKLAKGFCTAITAPCVGYNVLLFYFHIQAESKKRMGIFHPVVFIFTLFC